MIPQHNLAYAALKEALIEGRIAPGEQVTVLSVSTLLGMGTMPVRDALRRITAERGLEASSTRRLTVPPLTLSRFEELMQARLLIEPDAAVRAMPFLSGHYLHDIKIIDDNLGEAIRNRDVGGYMRLNYRFHFAIYRASPNSVLCPLIESLWLQFGPYMRMLFAHAQGHLLADQHVAALAAIRDKDELRLRRAVEDDIADAIRTVRRARL